MKRSVIVASSVGMWSWICSANLIDMNALAVAFCLLLSAVAILIWYVEASAPMIQLEQANVNVYTFGIAQVF